MISCDSITKIFYEQVVLNSFSYEFNTTGFYLLFGESGSGKTTFLNILSGFLTFDGGGIKFGSNTFHNKVDNSMIEDYFDYITQDAFFVDFLSVMDNMRLISDNDDAIMKILNQFGLGKKANQIPTTLSGGEKQRLSIVRALISGKKILFLDEPTAALDEGNKTAVFELLSKLKNDMLIICSSHDEQAKKYAEEVICFSKEKVKASDIKLIKTAKKQKFKNSKITKKTRENKNITRFLKKWFVSERRNKKSVVLFAIFLVLAFCLCIFADTPQHKFDTSIEYMYKINMLTVTTHGKIKWEDISPSSKGIKEVVLDYGRSCPDGNENLDDNVIMRPSPDYEMSLHVIPFDKEIFRLSGRIKYGTYFTDEKQIILSAEMANALHPNSPERLIGEHISKKIYGLGEIDFEIVGIFDYLNDFEKVYLRTLDVNIENGESYSSENYADLFFINSKITENFENDQRFYAGGSGQRCYRIYFDSYKDMKSYYDEYGNGLNENKSIYVEYSNLNINLYGVFEMLFYIMLPVAVFMALFAALFFITLKKTEYIYNNKFISVFEYLGYSKRKVINRFIRLNIFALIKTIALVTVITFAITFATNCFNEKFIFVNFQIFSYNIVLIVLFFVFLLLISFIFINAIFRKVKVSSWYENLIANRDLI